MTDKISWDKQLEIFDRMIRSGKSSEIKRSIIDLHKKGAPAEHRAEFANICRRIGRADLSVKLLVRIVNATDSESATDKEKVAFAAGLVSIGAGLEGARILSKIDTADNPDALLFRAFSHFTRWQYEEAVPYLQEYISHPKVSDYQNILGRVNLASALIFSGLNEKARDVLDDVLSEIESDRQYALAAGNAYELLSQTAIHLGENALAEVYLSKAESYLGDDSGIGKLFLDKWKAVNKIGQSTLKREGLTALQRVAKQALVRRHWETLRETQLFLAVGTKDEALFQKVFFGTPYSGYRKRMQKTYWRDSLLAETYTHQLQAFGNIYPDVLDLKTATRLNESQFVNPGSLLHKTFVALAHDIYKPTRITEIFSAVYPNDYFDPYSSPHRVHELINRLRKVLIKQSIPIQIVSKAGTYYLSATRPIGLRLHLDLSVQEPKNLELLNFLSTRKNPIFYAGELAQHLNVSKRTAQRIVKVGLNQGVLSRIKGGRETAYHPSVAA